MTIKALLSASEAISPYSPKDTESARFNPFQVELLINQAADLLDRMQRTNAAYEALRARDIEQKIAYELETGELKKIQDDLINKEATVIVDDIAPTTFKICEARVQAAFAQEQGLNHAYRHYNDAANSELGGDPRAFHTATATNVRTKWEKFSNKAIHHAELGEAKLFQDRCALKETILKFQQTESDKLGALNFEDQACKLLPLIKRDRDDAYIRLKCASKGLKHVYGDAFLTWAIEHELPDAGNLPDEADALEILVNWNRNVIAFLAAFSQRDQGFILSLSLKDSVVSGWDAWLKGNYNEAKFEVDPVHFNGLYNYIRLRGISAVLITKKQEFYPWKLIISPPFKQYEQTKDGLKDSIIEINSRVVLGRVESQNSLRAPDLAGMITLYNFSPCTPVDNNSRFEDCWLVTAKKPNHSIDNEELLDIRLELSLVGQPI
ncbi:hypothetical protein [Nitrosomonas ureae]|uniref:Uncharacterized protein n=1 Tax=Nitrosomonas ureae TaxID=44577 RepID=A0A286AJU8_9PROT|nr:hypothetical protein [Nitrosomonas ureae]SOD22173.1 hypothetical protein SAMN06297164_3376 [Nitrosomonas ureae]